MEKSEIPTDILKTLFTNEEKTSLVFESVNPWKIKKQVNINNEKKSKQR